MSRYTEEIKEKIKKFSSEPGRVFGLVYPYVLIIVTVLGFVYIVHINDSARLKINPALPDSTVQKDLPVVQGRTIPPIDLTKVEQPNPDLIAKGKAIFTSTCSACHGEQGNGKGPASTGLNPPPRNFTSDTGWKNGSKITQIFTTLQEGIPGSAMVAYDNLTPEEKFGLAQYIRTTFVPNPTQDTPGDFAALDQTYGLSKGKELPSQIPVADAEKIIINENNSKIQQLSRVMGLLSQENNDKGAQIFDQVTKNKAAAVTALNQDSTWRKSEQSFISFVTQNVIQNGFNGTVFNLKQDDWSTMYTFLSKVF